jgi:hypothetical protein
LEELLRVREEEGCSSGPTFGHRDGSVALMLEYNNLLHFFRRRVQDECPELILPDNKIKVNYRFSRTFQRTAEGRAKAAQLDSSVQNAMNRWRKIEEAKGKTPPVQHGGPLFACKATDDSHMALFICAIGGVRQPQPGLSGLRHNHTKE